MRIRRSPPILITWITISLLGIASIAIAPPASAQEFNLSRTDGGVLPGAPVALRGADADRRLVFVSASTKHAVPWTEIIALHGGAPRVAAPVAVHLFGGDEFKGVIEGGDEDGISLRLRTPALGLLEIPVDRVQTIVFRARAVDKGPADLRIAPDDDFGEALFQTAGRGLDVHGGELDRFSADGIYFARGKRSVARLYPFDSLVGLAIRAGIAAEQPGGWSLVTRAGDRLRVDWTGVDDERMHFRTEFRAVSLPHSQVAALTRMVGGRHFLSDLEPQRVAETGSDAAIDAAPLFAFQRDRTVSGGLLLDRRSPADGFLVVVGRTYGKGLGVHSKCLLTYRVPPGMTKFHAKVAIDDEVQSLGVRGDADVVVRVGAKEVFRATGLRSSEPPKNLGIIPVRPGTLLTLEVGFGKGLFLGDRVDWLSAVFLR